MEAREKISLDADWKFHYGDIVSIRNRWAWGKSGSWNQGPESTNFDDSDWESVELPHDFVIATEPVSYMEKEFDDADNAIPAMEDVNNMHTTAGSFRRDVGWYRKRFFLPACDESRRIYLVFEGIFRDSSVYLNDFFVGGERSGYKEQVIDITDFVNYGGENLLSVKADARGSEGWFYEGGGIYRHVYLLKMQPQHFDNVFVWSEVKPGADSAAVNVRLEIAGMKDGNLEDETAGEVKVELFDPDGRRAARKKISTDRTSWNGENMAVELSFALENVRLWDTEHPFLYRAEAALFLGGEIKDEYIVKFGIRDIHFDADKGFLLNGVQTKLKGVCCHQNHGGIGTAIPDEVYRYRIRLLKKMGANAYRTSHYPPAPALLDICDEEGMLVMDETRLLSSEKGDMEQLSCMVKRDRNHPSVILYSIGNEEAQSQTTPQGARIAGSMIQCIRRLDPYTPVTMALLMWDLKNKKPMNDIGLIAGISKKLDVAGFNYHDERWEDYHREFPAQPFVCTEQGTFKSTRGCYATDAEKCHLAITDEREVSYMKGAKQWHVCRPDWVSGLFLWTGFDYYGEPTPYAWPAISSQFGAMDLCGFPKDFYYYYKAWWGNDPVLHIFPGWYGTPGEKKKIHVFSNCEEVELFANGISLGRKTMEEDGCLIWEDVVYVPGELIGVGYADGREILGEVLRTPGEPFALRLSLSFREGNIAVVCAEIVDENGWLVPDGDDELLFETDKGRILGTANGDPSDHMLPTGNRRRTFHGKAQAIIKAEGTVTITVKAVTMEKTEQITAPGSKLHGECSDNL